MSEMISAHITIGGRIPGNLVQEFCKVICEYRVGLGWRGESFEPQTAQDLLEAKCDGKMHLRLFVDDALWTEFEPLEQFLMKHQIPFDCHHEAIYAIVKAKLIYRPNVGAFEFLADDSGEMLCQTKPVLPVVKMLAQRRQT